MEGRAALAFEDNPKAAIMARTDRANATRSWFIMAWVVARSVPQRVRRPHGQVGGFRSESGQAVPRRCRQLSRPCMPSSTIEWLFPDGSGGARLDRGIVRIPGALPGDVVRWRAEGGREAAVVGALEAIERPSPERVTPPCPWDALCGGCAAAYSGTTTRGRTCSTGRSLWMRFLGLVAMMDGEDEDHVRAPRVSLEWARKIKGSPIGTWRFSLLAPPLWLG